MSDEHNPLEVDGGKPFEAKDADKGEAAWTDRDAPGDSPDEGIPPPPPEPIPLIEISEEQVRGVLRAQGALLHGTAAVEKDSTEWVYLQADLDAIVPPLTRIVNRYDVLARAMAHGDFLAIALGMAGYGKRSLEERAAGLARAQAAVAAEPTGQADGFEYVGPVPG